MPEEQLHSILRHLRRHFPGAGLQELTDRQLLERFARHRDEAAFAALVQRHGPMVYGVCRRVLRWTEDAEDAFQAAFMVLARKAAVVAWRESIVRWLYQVAYRVAAEARTRNARRDALEKQAADRRKPASVSREPLGGVCAVLDEALHALPARYQQPLVLCYLQGLTRDQAAAHLGWSLRTLERRLAQGRERLRQVLTRRGVTMSGALLAASLSGMTGNAAGTRLAAATVRASVAFAAGKGGGGAVSATAAVLAEVALHGAIASPARIVALFALLLTLAAGGVGVLVAVSGNGINTVLRGEAAPQAVAPPQADEMPAPRQDRLGDPLPPGAVARMGSSRFRHLTHMAGLNVVVSPDSKTLLTSSEYGARAWSLASGKLLYDIRDVRYRQPAFSPDGKWLAITDGSVVRLCDPVTGRKVRHISPDGSALAEALAFSADSRRLAVALNKSDIRIFDIATSRQIGSLDVQGRGKIRDVHSLVFASDGRTLVSMGWDEKYRDTICHWDLETQNLLNRVVPAYGSRPTARLSPDGRLLAVPVRGRPVTIWDTKTGQVRCTLQGDRNRAGYGLAFSPDSKLLATAFPTDRDALASLWDTTTGKLRRRFRVPYAAVEDLHFSSDGRLLLIPGRCYVRLWDIATGQEVLPQDAHTAAVTSLAFTPDGQALVSGGDETIRVWDAKTGEQRQVMVAHRWQVNQVRVRPDGRTVVSCGADGAVRLHDLTSGKELRRCLAGKDPDTLRDIGRQLFWLGLAPDGRTAATFANPLDREPAFVDVWDLDSGRRLSRRPNTDSPFGGAFSPDARLLVSPRFVPDPAGGKATAKDGGKMKAAPDAKAKAPAAEGPLKTLFVVREVATGRELLTLPQPDESCQSLAFTPDGQCVVTATFTSISQVDASPNTLRLWELTTGKQRCAITSPTTGKQRNFSRLAVAPDGRTVAAVCGDLGIELWDLATGKDLLRLAGNGTHIYSLAFSPDGRRLVTGHGDSAILIWDVAAAYERRPRPRPAEPRELENWWRDLAGEASAAHRAIWSLAGVPAQALPLLRDRLRPAVPVPADELQRLLQDLDNPRFRLREAASRRLADFGEDAEPALRQTLANTANTPSAEVRQRIERILAQPRLIRSPDLLRSLRALQVLEGIGDQPARRLLGKLAEGAPASPLTREAKAALARLNR
jgi:RNA polymerase sigma factor (sigma-70 family)